MKDVTKTFAKGKSVVQAVRDANLEITSGEFFGILGPSGSGKTTTLRLIAGLEEPTKGQIFFDDQLVAADGKIIVPAEKRNIGLVFQTWALYPHMTAYDNIAFPLVVKKLDRSEIAKRVSEVASVLGIEDVLQKYPREISGGQQQRVSLARALVKNPSLLLLDEPFSNLDALIRDAARALVRDVQKKLGITTIVVSHDPADMFALVQKAAVIVNGTFKQVDNLNTIYERPADFRVASLLGEINLFDGEVTDGTFVSEELKLKIGSKTKGKATLGIRPEDVRIEDESEGLLPLGTFSVLVSSYQGGAFRITMSKGKKNLVFISDVPYLVGKELNLYVVKGRMKLFSESGEFLETV
jgi:glucose/arabinose transport system ATP-binding protein